MENYLVSADYVSRDLFVLQFGQDQCAPGYQFGPCARNNYLIHYVVSGRGTYSVGGRDFELRRGMAFLIKPGQLTRYRADEEDPWFYQWIEFGGENCETFLARAGFTAEAPILRDGQGKPLRGAMAALLALGGGASSEAVMAAAWNVAAAITAGRSQPGRRAESDYHLRRAAAYIQSHIHRRILVSEVAEYVGVDRSYLGRLFLRSKGVSTQRYIINAKLEAAAQFLMQNPSLSVKEVARSAGYEDQLDFSKAFKARYGMSPTLWRKTQVWEHSVKK